LRTAFVLVRVKIQSPKTKQMKNNSTLKMISLSMAILLMASVASFAQRGRDRDDKNERNERDDHNNRNERYERDGRNESRERYERDGRYESRERYDHDNRNNQNRRNDWDDRYDNSYKNSRGPVVVYQQRSPFYIGYETRFMPRDARIVMLRGYRHYAYNGYLYREMPRRNGLISFQITARL
jgi:hypothetical protein